MGSGLFSTGFLQAICFYQSLVSIVDTWHFDAMISSASWKLRGWGRDWIPSLIISLELNQQIALIHNFAGFPGGSVVKNLPANAEDTGYIPGSGRSHGEGNGNNSSILVWEIPWTKEPDGLQSIRSWNSWHDLATKQQLNSIKCEYSEIQSKSILSLIFQIYLNQFNLSKHHCMWFQNYFSSDN